LDLSYVVLVRAGLFSSKLPVITPTDTTWVAWHRNCAGYAQSEGSLNQKSLITHKQESWISFAYLTRKHKI